MSLGWKTAIVAVLALSLFVLKIVGGRRRLVRFRAEHLQRRDRLWLNSQAKDQVASPKASGSSKASNSSSASSSPEPPESPNSRA